MGRLKATTDTPEAEAYIIAVPTPFNDDHTADLSYIRSATEQIAPKLHGGEIVVIESTSPPGTTETVSRWLAELRPDLVLPHATEGIPDVYVAHCPERVLPGRIMIEMITNDRVVGGVSPRCAAKAAVDLPGVLEGQDPAHRRGQCGDGQAGRERLPRRQHRLRQRVVADLRLVEARRLGGHQDGQPAPAGQHLESRARGRRSLHRGRPVVHRGCGARSGQPDPYGSGSQRRQAGLCRQPGRARRRSGSGIRSSPASDSRSRPTSTTSARVLPVSVVSVDRRGPARRRHPGLRPLRRRAAPELADRDNVRLQRATEAIADADIVALLVEHDKFKALSRNLLEGKVVFDTRGVWRLARPGTKPSGRSPSPKKCSIAATDRRAACPSP